MEENIETSNLTLNEEFPQTRRRKLLPWWIKVFTWLFLIFGGIVPIASIVGLFGVKFQLSIYGFETNDPLSLTGISLLLLFVFKGIVAFGLWTEKNWAILLGQVDAVLGIAICLVSMVFIPLFYIENGFHLNFRLELVILIPYIIKLQKIKEEWANRSEFLLP